MGPSFTPVQSVSALSCWPISLVLFCMFPTIKKRLRFSLYNFSFHSVSCQPATSPLLQQKWSSPVLLSKETPICKGFQPLLNDIRSLFVEITIKDLQSRSPYWTWVLRTSQTSLTVKQLLILEKFVTEALG